MPALPLQLDDHHFILVAIPRDRQAVLAQSRRHGLSNGPVGVQLRDTVYSTEGQPQGGSFHGVLNGLLMEEHIPSDLPSGFLLASNSVGHVARAVTTREVRVLITEDPLLLKAGDRPIEPVAVRCLLTFSNSVPFIIGVWLCAAFPPGTPVWFAAEQMLGGVGWVENVGVADSIFYAVGILLVAFVWTLLALFAAKVTRDWAARRRYFQGEEGCSARPWAGPERVTGPRCPSTGTGQRA